MSQYWQTNFFSFLKGTKKEKRVRNSPPATNFQLQDSKHYPDLERLINISQSEREREEMSTCFNILFFLSWSSPTPSRFVSLSERKFILHRKTKTGKPQEDSLSEYVQSRKKNANFSLKCLRRFHLHQRRLDGRLVENEEVWERFGIVEMTMRWDSRR